MSTMSRGYTPVQSTGATECTFPTSIPEFTSCEHKRYRTSRQIVGGSQLHHAWLPRPISMVPGGNIEWPSNLQILIPCRRADILAYFDHPGTSNEPTEALNERLEHLRGIAVGFRNPGNYLMRSLLHAGGMDRLLQPYLCRV